MSAHPWLLPFGLLFGAGAALRVDLYRRGLLSQGRLPAPVISVGNLSVGGSGKTPLVAWIAERLRDAGHAVAVLSRGYAGSFRGACLVVSDGARLLAGPREAGDEPFMLARTLPGVVVAVGRNRHAAGREVVARFGRRVMVLDDGFQHLRLARDLDVLCFSTADLRDWPLPAGRLREFPRAAQRAHFRILVLAPGEDSPRLRGATVEGAIRVRRRPIGLFTLAGEPQPSPERALLLSGIARPQAFAADAEACLPWIVEHAVFRDHHRFRPAELTAVFARARRQGADAVVTTEKDAARLHGQQLPDAPRLLVLRTGLELLGGEAFLERLLAVARGES